MLKNFLNMEGGRKGCGVYANAQTGSQARKLTAQESAFRPTAWQGAAWDDMESKSQRKVSFTADCRTLLSLTGCSLLHVFTKQ